MRIKLIVLTVITIVSLQNYVYGQDSKSFIIFNPGISICEIMDSKNDINFLGYGLEISTVIPNKFYAFSWLSAGSIFYREGQFNKAYLEGGIWVVANLGLGYSYSRIDNTNLSNVHLFIGLPIPLNAGFFDFHLADEELYYIQPYTRIGLTENSRYFNEVGVQMKISYNFFRKMLY